MVGNRRSKYVGKNANGLCLGGYVIYAQPLTRKDCVPTIILNIIRTILFITFGFTHLARGSSQCYLSHPQECKKSHIKPLKHIDTTKFKQHTNKTAWVSNGKYKVSRSIYAASQCNVNHSLLLWRMNPGSHVFPSYRSSANGMISRDSQRPCKLLDTLFWRKNMLPKNAWPNNKSIYKEIITWNRHIDYILL